MRTNSSPTGAALLLILLGSLAMIAATAAVFLTHVPEWRYLIAGGGFVQFAGWVLHRRHARGGAR